MWSVWLGRVFPAAVSSNISVGRYLLAAVGPISACYLAVLLGPIVIAPCIALVMPRTLRLLQVAGVTTSLNPDDDQSQCGTQVASRPLLCRSSIQWGGKRGAWCRLIDPMSKPASRAAAFSFGLSLWVTASAEDSTRGLRWKQYR
jgi:hypothetical protein